MKHITKPQLSELNSTVDNSMEEDDHLVDDGDVTPEMDEDEIQDGVHPQGVDRGTFSLVEETDVSQAYDNIDSENQSPNMSPVVKPSKGKGVKRQAVEEDLDEPAPQGKGRGRKKQKSPTKEQSIFSPDSEEPSSSAQVPQKEMNKRKPAEQDLEEPTAQPKGRGRKKQKSPEKQQTDSEAEIEQTSAAPVVVKNAKKSRKAPTGPKPIVHVTVETVDDNASPIQKAIIRNKKATQEEKPNTKPPRKAKVVPEKASAKIDSASNDQEARELRIRAAKVTATAMPSTSSAPSAAPIKIKIPVQPRSTQHPPLKNMLSATMEFFRPEKKGVSIKEVIHYLAHEYEYRNEMAIKKAVKVRITSGEYIKTTGVGLNGKFKLPPISKRAKKTDDSVTSQSNTAKPRKQSKAINEMTEVKANKKRKSLAIKAVKAPKVKKTSSDSSATKGKGVKKNTKSDAKPVKEKKAPKTKAASKSKPAPKATGKVKKTASKN